MHVKGSFCRHIPHRHVQGETVGADAVGNLQLCKFEGHNVQKCMPQPSCILIDAEVWVPQDVTQ